MPPIEAEDIWPVVRRLYEETSFTVAEVAGLTGVNPRTLHQRAGREGWARRRATRGAAAAERRADIATRLWQVLARQLAELEARGADGAAGAAQDLATLTRALDKLVDLERGLNAAAAPPPDEGPMDLDAFRDEVTRRLEGVLGTRPDR